MVRRMMNVLLAHTWHNQLKGPGPLQSTDKTLTKSYHLICCTSWSWTVSKVGVFELKAASMKLTHHEVQWCKCFTTSNPNRKVWSCWIPKIQLYLGTDCAASRNLLIDTCYMRVSMTPRHLRTDNERNVSESFWNSKNPITTDQVRERDASHPNKFNNKNILPDRCWLHQHRPQTAFIRWFVRCMVFSTFNTTAKACTEQDQTRFFANPFLCKNKGILFS